MDEPLHDGTEQHSFDRRLYLFHQENDVLNWGVEHRSSVHNIGQQSCSKQCCFRNVNRHNGVCTCALFLDNLRLSAFFCTKTFIGTIKKMIATPASDVAGKLMAIACRLIMDNDYPLAATTSEDNDDGRKTTSDGDG